MQRRITRTSNAEIRPGLSVDRPKPRRTSAQVQADKAALAAAKKEAVQRQDDNMSKVAHLEHEARKKIKETDLNANKPKDKLKIPRTKRPTSSTIHEDDDANASTVAEPETNNMIQEPGESTVDELMADTSGADMDMEDDAPDTTIKKVDGGKKQKKGLAIRDQINSISSSEVTTKVSAGMVPAALKRTADIAGNVVDGTGPPKRLKATSKSSQPSGIIPNWEKAALTEPSYNGPTKRKDDKRSNPGNDSITESESEEDNTVAFGGMTSEDEDVEPLRHVDNFLLLPTLQSLAKIEELQPAPITPRIDLRQMKPGDRFKHEHLPHETVQKFSKMVIPMAYDTAGALDPWDAPDDIELVELWNLGFKDTYPITVDHTQGSLFLVVKRLIKRGLSNWLNKLGTAGVKALEAEYLRQGLSTDAEKAELVSMLLGDASDITSKIRPFLWESVYDDPDTDKSGLFQGRLVARVLSEHLKEIQPIPDDYRIQEPPVGALILSIQAVHRALLYSVTGSYNPPAGKPGEFSKANWGDFTAETVNGKMKPVKRATVFLKRVNGLKEAQWMDIKRAALVTREGSRGASKKGPALPVEESDLEESDDDELRDPRYDSDTTEPATITS
ncbi:hypothetical protein Hypma_016566 [Hypsizygus marmoreus]|uniref:Uncharacterized protein n=1 Tax=Hypsizygus marmoreus TaxID=39966 RepID=A0A369J4V9_HYPMA|nr:hypothetical protein Hypma_016566 [Hypsizygus marmoreus]